MTGEETRNNKTESIRKLLEKYDVKKVEFYYIGDAIGFLAFYHREAATAEYMDKVIETVERHREDEVITWKGIICLSAFPYVKSREFLKSMCENNKNKLLVQEAERALRVMK